MQQYQLFFWFFPPGPDGSLDDLIFWCVMGSSIMQFADDATRYSKDKWWPWLFLA